MKATTHIERDIEVGKVYNCNHTRKGKFSLEVTDVGEEWITGIITNGYTQTMMEYNSRSVGETETVRRSFCMFTEVL
jgi:hypothetical protein